MVRGQLLAVSLAAAMAAVLGSAAATASGIGGAKPPTKATVVSVTDGDTINVSLHGRTQPVRFTGIDTPEVYPVKDCGGDDATASMNQMLKSGDRVKLVRDRSQDNRDVYERLLRYVELKGKDLGRKQVSRGWAEVYVFDRRFKRVGAYRRKQRQARRHDRGVWGMCPGNFPP
jgi:micrococcal nuclease